MLEVPGFFDEDGFRYIKGRQTKFILIGDIQYGLTNWDHLKVVKKL